MENARGFVASSDNAPLRCNNRNPLLSGLLAGGPFLREPLLAALEGHLQTAASEPRCVPDALSSLSRNPKVHWSSEMYYCDRIDPDPTLSTYFAPASLEST